jgi:deoxycytidylate deaminase
VAASSKAARPSLPIAGGTPSSLIGPSVEGARTHDLVFAVTGYAGAGASHVAGALVQHLQGAGYTSTTIKMSDLIATALEKRGIRAPADPSRLARAAWLQDGGDTLRNKHGADFVAGLAIREIVRQRASAGDARQRPPIAFILDSLKRPEEAESLRSVYQHGFYLVSVIVHESIRRLRLGMKFKGATSVELDRFMERDEADPANPDLGQHVRKTLHLGDFFVSNDLSNEAPPALDEAEQPPDALERFIDLVLRRRVVRPTRHERGMYEAWTASLRSACLSRQVGAAILDAAGEVLSTGTNDVPRYGGGLYDDEDGEADHRCHRWWRNDQPPQCHNDATKRQIYEQIYEQLRPILGAAATADQVRAAVEKTRVKDLIEFSRAVHAEMDALVGIARNGSRSCRGGVLYCTTYPCHACARHIVAAGIHEVFYIEPYTKSMATELHQDAIVDTTATHGARKEYVRFQLFSGVAPRRFTRLFEKRTELKDKGGLYAGTPTVAGHQDPVLTQAFPDLERGIAARIDQMETATASADPGGPP